MWEKTKNRHPIGVDLGRGDSHFTQELCFHQVEAASKEREKSEIFRAQKGGDFNTKKCLVLRAPAPNPDPGPFLGLHRL